MKEGPGSSLILGPAKGSLVVRQRGVAFLLASVGRADLQLLQLENDGATMFGYRILDQAARL